jgi:hypothetical protein
MAGAAPVLNVPHAAIAVLVRDIEQERDRALGAGDRATCRCGQSAESRSGCSQLDLLQAQSPRLDKPNPNIV